MARTTVVTGAASGIGRALAGLLRERGEEVIGVDVHEAEVIADLGTADGRDHVVDEVTRRSDGRLDAVVAVAGSAVRVPETASINYFGAVATLEGLRPALRSSDSPRAAVTSSLAALQPHDDRLLEALEDGDEHAALAEGERIVAAGEDPTGNAIYNTSKRALARWVRRQSVTEQWAGEGIALNAIAPGIVETPMTAAILAIPEGRAVLEAGAPAPLNGFAPPAAPAELLAWLVSPANTHVTGQVIFLDGGSEALHRPDHL